MSGPSLEERLLRSLVDDLWISLVVFDPEWRVVLWNRKSEELFGLSSEAARGKALEETGVLPDLSYGPSLRARV